MTKRNRYWAVAYGHVIRWAGPCQTPDEAAYEAYGIRLNRWDRDRVTIQEFPGNPKYMPLYKRRQLLEALENRHNAKIAAFDKRDQEKREARQETTPAVEQSTVEQHATTADVLPTPEKKHADLTGAEKLSEIRQAILELTDPRNDEANAAALTYIRTVLGVTDEEVEAYARKTFGFVADPGRIPDSPYGASVTLNDDLSRCVSCDRPVHTIDSRGCPVCHHENFPEYLMVVRHCCTSGNCGTCLAQEGHKYGQTVKVVQLVTSSIETARRYADNWKAYGAEVKSVTEREVSELHHGSALYVRERMLRPKYIS